MHYLLELCILARVGWGGGKGEVDNIAVVVEDTGDIESAVVVIASGLVVEVDTEAEAPELAECSVE